MDERNRFTPDTHELAWAAGFFDGEGNIRAKLNKQSPRSYYYLAISINQVDPQVLERFRRAVGVGKVAGPYDRSRYAGAFSRKPQWTYEAYSFEKIQAVLAMLWKWLSPVKQEQARTAIMEVRSHRVAVASRWIVRGCIAEGCDRPADARDLCPGHYAKDWRRRTSRRGT